MIDDKIQRNIGSFGTKQNIQKTRKGKIREREQNSCNSFITQTALWWVGLLLVIVIYIIIITIKVNTPSTPYNSLYQVQE